MTTCYLVASLLLLVTLRLSTSLPIVDPGLFVIMGVSTCRAGDGYCLLGADCTTDEDFLPDDEDGHCDGLRNAFTPSAHFICCKYNAKNTTTVKPMRQKPLPLPLDAAGITDLFTQNTQHDDLDMGDQKPELFMTNVLPFSKKDHVDISEEIGEVESKVNTGDEKVSIQDKEVVDTLSVEKVGNETPPIEDVVKIEDNVGKDKVAQSTETLKKVGNVEKVELPLKEVENIDMAFKLVNEEMKMAPGVVVSEVKPATMDVVVEDVMNEEVAELPIEDDIQVNDWSPIVYTLLDDGDMKEIELDVKIPMESPGMIKLPGINKSTAVTVDTVRSDAKQSTEQLNSIRRRL